MSRTFAGSVGETTHSPCGSAGDGWLGWGDDDLAGSGSDALVDAIVAWGDEAAIASRIKEHLDAGADHVCIQPVTEVRPLFDGPDTQAIGVLRRLAGAVRDL